MELTQVLRMNTGDGDESYAKNSVYQKLAVLHGKRAMKEAILDFCSSNVGSIPRPVFVVADLGCSSGPNTIFMVSNVVAAVAETCMSLGRRPPAIQAFFNDLPGTDFNTLFRSLPSKWGPESEAAPPRCFVAGAPGSFYGRLFPDSSVHLFHSAFAVHFLSRAPRELGKEGCIVNKGCVFASRSSDERVSRAYYEQYQKDFSTFLRLRSEEMVSGGRMLLIFSARTEEFLEDSGMADVLQLLADILMDMVKQGFVDEEKVDYFNFPMYFPSREEVELEIGKEGSFSIKLLELFDMLDRRFDPYDERNNARSDGLLDGCKDTRGVLGARMLRAVYESMLSAHFGEDMLDILFQRLGESMDAYLLKSIGAFHSIMISLERE